MEDRLYADPALVRFYDLENGWAPDLDYCAGLAEGAGSVLDLGCGTGLFLAGIGTPERVGVDPAAAMLEVARARPGGQGVTWVNADARGLDLGRRFDLVVLTGHAFQVFLTDADRAAVLATIARHLAPRGHFVFDSRNPAREEWREWTPAGSRRRFDAPGLGSVEAWNDVAHDPATGVVTYQTHYRLPEGRTLAAESRIAFPQQDHLAALIDEAGLVVDDWLGGWDGSPFAPDAAEIIPVGRLR